MRKYEDMTAIERGIFWIEKCYDVRHQQTFGRHEDAKPDLLILVEYCRKADNALRWVGRELCECGKIENESGICPICEAIELRNKQ